MPTTRVPTRRGAVRAALAAAATVAVAVALGWAVPAPAAGVPLAGTPPVAATGSPRAEVPTLARPAPGEVVAGFHADGRYGAGHRGVDLAVVPGTAVVAPVAGRVTFAGAVAGGRWVTVAPTPRVLVTVGPLAHVVVRRGDLVAVGTPVGTSAAAHGHDRLHLSLRVDGVHVDPAPHLAGPTPRRASLVPPDP